MRSAACDSLSCCSKTSTRYNVSPVLRRVVSASLLTPCFYAAQSAHDNLPNSIPCFSQDPRLSTPDTPTPRERYRRKCTPSLPPPLGAKPVTRKSLDAHLRVRLDRRVGEQDDSGGVDEVNHLHRVLARSSIVAVPPQRLRKPVALRYVRERFELSAELGGHQLHVFNGIR